MKAGFIGTGSMGAPLAANLLDQEKSLVAYDINPEATVKLAEKQARIVDSPVVVADESDLVFACMPSIESFHPVCTMGSELARYGRLDASSWRPFWLRWCWEARTATAMSRT